ncbi:MAG: N,N'-diacetylchitobiose phosphorylase [Spirochaetales bacterium]|nr:N,N'-diacetylchitobiose phosphorylase [Candidatus Physcosoma equi]
MKYGHFDAENREYVIDRPDVPVSWTNYLGTEETGAVLSHNAGGYMFHKDPETHRITRFRANAVPLDRPGHYVYLRDNKDGDYWTISWQPVGKDLDKAEYKCRHGLSYSVFESKYKGISASEKLFIPRGETTELWDVRIKNDSEETRNLSVVGYVEFSFNIIEIDNQNFQMSMYCSGSAYEDGVIECDNFYNPTMYHYFTSSFTPSSYDCVRDSFVGVYHTESNPVGIEKGKLSGSTELGNNQCGALETVITLAPGEEKRLVFMLGVGDRKVGKEIQTKFSSPVAVDKAFSELCSYWEEKLSTFQINTPSCDMNNMLNVWNLYQSETNVVFSRFASFIEVGGRTGLGYRDTAQDAMCVIPSNPGQCRKRIIQLLRGLTTMGYGLHLFDPAVFDPDTPREIPFKSPTVKPTPEASSMVHGLKDTCSDDALWLVPSICEYVRETGDVSFLDEVYGYADGGKGTVLEHMERILKFSEEQVGAHGICKGLRADWNDCLNLGGGESALVSFLHYWALDEFITLLEATGKKDEAARFEKMKETVKEACERELWDGDWYIRGFTKNGMKIGTKEDTEGKVQLESNAWAICSGLATGEHGEKALKAIDDYLYSPWGIHLNAPSYGTPNDDIGFITRVYKGIKENGAIFSHPNPWAWVAAAKLGHGDVAMRFYESLCPAAQNDKIEIRQSEPYAYCQFIMGRDHTAFGRARHPWLTGSAGWAYFASTHYMLGIRPDYDGLVVDPCIPHDWDGYEVDRVFRGAAYHVTVKNPDHKEKGVKEILFNGKKVSKVPIAPKGTKNTVEVLMG